MFPLRTEGTDISGGLVNEPVANHFVFPLESFSGFGSRTCLDWAIMRPVLRVYVCVRTVNG